MNEHPPIFCARCEREPEYLIPANYAPDIPWGLPDHYVCCHCDEPIGNDADAALREWLAAED
jgi:hypothetical protein